MQYLKIFALLLCALILSKGWYKVTDGFKVSKITHTPYIFRTWQENNEKQTPHKIKAILKRPFYYLGRGQQCYAFESEDGKYVIKLLRLHKYQRPFWCALFPNDSLINHRKSSWDYTMKSLQLAWDELKDESALVYLHKETTVDLPLITIYDKVKRKSSLDSNSLLFVIQKKAKPITYDLQRWKKNPKEAKRFIDSYMQTIARRIDKSIRNKNRRVIKNLGWLEDQIVEFDVGEFRKHPHVYSLEEKKKEAIKSTKRLRLYLQHNHPDLVSYLDKRVENLYL